MFLDGRVEAGGVHPCSYFETSTHMVNPLQQDWRHSGSVNGVFVDGHVQSVRPADVTKVMFSEE
jgi:prepilin-type processing-associated H-X9-DG protein